MDLVIVGIVILKTKKIEELVEINYIGDLLREFVTSRLFVNTTVIM